MVGFLSHHYYLLINNYFASYVRCSESFHSVIRDKYIFLFTRLQFSYKIYFQPNKNINSTCAIITRRNIHNGYTVA